MFQQLFKEYGTRSFQNDKVQVDKIVLVREIWIYGGSKGGDEPDEWQACAWKKTSREYGAYTYNPTTRCRAFQTADHTVKEARQANISRRKERLIVDGRRSFASVVMGEGRNYSEPEKKQDAIAGVTEKSEASW